LGSYLALQLGLIRGDDWVFPSFILAAALCMIVSLTERFNPFSMLVEVSWAVISVIEADLESVAGQVGLFSLSSYAAAQKEALATFTAFPSPRARRPAEIIDDCMIVVSSGPNPRAPSAVSS